MKSYQFEEITFWLSLIACLLAHEAKNRLAYKNTYSSQHSKFCQRNSDGLD